MPNFVNTIILFLNFILQAARPQYVLFWCWAAALGAGLLKSEDMMLGATRLRVTFDILYEEENLSILMDEAAKVTTMVSLLLQTN